MGNDEEPTARAHRCQCEGIWHDPVQLERRSKLFENSLLRHRKSVIDQHTGNIDTCERHGRMEFHGVVDLVDQVTALRIF